MLHIFFVKVYQNLFVHSTVNRLLLGFQFEAIINNACTNNASSCFLWTCVHVYMVNIYLGDQLLGHRVQKRSTLGDPILPNSFSKLFSNLHLNAPLSPYLCQYLFVSIFFNTLWFKFAFSFSLKTWTLHTFIVCYNLSEMHTQICHFSIRFLFFSCSFLYLDMSSLPQMCTANIYFYSVCCLLTFLMMFLAIKYLIFTNLQNFLVWLLISLFI